MENRLGFGKVIVEIRHHVFETQCTQITLVMLLSCARNNRSVQLFLRYLLVM